VIVDEIRDQGPACDLIAYSDHEEPVARFLELVDTSIRQDQKRARQLLESIAMGNLRKAMAVFSSFLISGHTDAGKILSIVEQSENYLVPLHEFIKSIGLGDNRNYQSESSVIANLFTIADESRPCHFTKLRILEYLFFRRGQMEPIFGLGFVRLSSIANSFEKIGTSEADLRESLQTMAAYSLVENDIYDSKKVSDAYRITSAGRYYIRYLLPQFSYLDLVLQDTPINDSMKLDAIKEMIYKHDLNDRFSRVRLFLEYLNEQEQKQFPILQAKADSPQMLKLFMPQIILSFESAAKAIKRKVNKRKSTYSGEKTPYKEL
jgi:hypothetical protein